MYINHKKKVSFIFVLFMAFIMTASAFYGMSYFNVYAEEDPAAVSETQAEENLSVSEGGEAGSVSAEEGTEAAGTPQRAAGGSSDEQAPAEDPAVTQPDPAVTEEAEDEISVQAAAKSKHVEVSGNDVVFSTVVYGSNAGNKGKVYTNLPLVSNAYLLDYKCRPYSLKFTAYSNKTLLEWNDVNTSGGNVDGYIVVRKAGSENRYTQIAKTGKNVRYYYDTKATAKNTNYYYIVFGYKNMSDGSIQVAPASLSCVGQLLGSARVNAYGDYAPKINATSKQMTVGSKYSLTLKYDSKCFSTWTRWRSHNTTVAAVSNSGVVTAKKEGTCLISAKTPDGRDVRCTVTVVKASASTVTYPCNGRVHNGPVTFRKTASSSGTAVGTRLSGSGIILTGLVKDSKGNKWYSFDAGSNGTCYLPYNNVNLVTTSGGLTTEKFVTTLDSEIYNTTEYWSSPAASGKKLGTVTRGSKFKCSAIITDANGKKWARYATAKYGNVFVALNDTAVPGISVTEATYSPYKMAACNAATNVYTGANSALGKKTTLSKGTDAKVTQKIRTYKTYYYKMTVGSKTYYAVISTLDLSSGTVLTDAQFEEAMTKQGFPDSYKPYLRTLHKAHPDWQFTALKTGISWSTATGNAIAAKNNYIDRSYAGTAWATGTNTYDGGWYMASAGAVRFYMDPRNFLTESGIYQFLDQHYYSGMARKSHIEDLVSSNTCFMDTPTYINAIYNAGKNSQVNPNILTAMVIQEQGWSGNTGLVSGTNPKYPGYYNHFNIGAYHANGMTATERGLWFAAGSGVGSTTYGRPWNTIERSLTGGVSFYKQEYIDNKQYTYYTKKFNVMNGASNVGTHEYSTLVSGAYQEGMLVKKAYRNNDQGLVFRIPVYTGLPAANAAAPK